MKTDASTSWTSSGELSKPLDTASSTKTLSQTNSERRRGHQITFRAAEANIAKLIWVERGQNSNFTHKRLCVANQKGKLGKFGSDIINCLTQVIHKSWMRAEIINQRNTKRGSTFYTTWIQSWTFSSFSAFQPLTSWLWCSPPPETAEPWWAGLGLCT